MINSHISYKTFLEKLFETLKTFEEEIILVTGGSKNIPPRTEEVFGKSVICIDIEESNFDFNGFMALNRYKDHPLVKADGYMYIHDTCLADKTFQVKFNNFTIEEGNTYVFGTSQDIDTGMNQSFICAFAWDIIGKYNNAFDKIVTKKEAIEIEAGKGETITKYGKVNYVNKRSYLGLDDYYNEGKQRMKSYYDNWGLFKLYVY